MKFWLKSGMRKGLPGNKSKSKSTSLNGTGIYANHAAVRLTNASMTGRLAECGRAVLQTL
jgi:hypothetical protein